MIKSFFLSFFSQRYSEQLSYHRKKVAKLESFMMCFTEKVQCEGEPPVKKGRSSIAVEMATKTVTAIKRKKTMACGILKGYV